MFDYQKLRTILIATAAAIVFQLICSSLVVQLIPAHQVSFPFMLSQPAGAGSLTNLVGYGHIPHTLSMQRFYIGLLVVCTILLLGCSRLPVLRWLPVTPLPGSFANLSDGLVHGAVIDWIILPIGGHHIKAISPGDVIIQIGMLLWLIAIAKAAGKKRAAAVSVQPPSNA